MKGGKDEDKTPPAWFTSYMEKVRISQHSWRVSLVSHLSTSSCIYLVQRPGGSWGGGEDLPGVLWTVLHPQTSGWRIWSRSRRSRQRRSSGRSWSSAGPWGVFVHSAWSSIVLHSSLLLLQGADYWRRLPVQVSFLILIQQKSDTSPSLELFCFLLFTSVI